MLKNKILIIVMGLLSSMFYASNNYPSMVEKKVAKEPTTHSLKSEIPITTVTMPEDIIVDSETEKKFKEKFKSTFHLEDAEADAQEIIKQGIKDFGLRKLIYIF